MIKKIFNIIIISLCVIFTTEASEPKFASYPRDLKPIVQMIMRSPDARNLLAKVSREGPVRIEVRHSKGCEFEGYWEGVSRTITINRPQNHNPGEVINTLLFEMHNAEADRRLRGVTDQACAGLIDKETFVRETERIEHENCLKTYRIIAKEIRSGTFPRSAQHPIIWNFNDHYKQQQLLGHSIWLAEEYDRYHPSRRVPYKGTVAGLNRMSWREKDRILRTISMRNQTYPM